MGQDRDVPGTGTGDEFDEIRARVDRIRREAQQRIDELRGATGLDVRLPPRPGVRRPGAAAAPDRLPPSRPTRADAGPPVPVVPDRPAPPPVASGGDWRGRVAPERSEPAEPAPKPPALEVPPQPASDASPVPVAPATPPAPVEPPLSWVGPSADVAAPTPAPAGRTSPVEELPPPGAGWDAFLVDLPYADGRGRSGTDDGRAGVGLFTGLRELVERIAATRSLTVLLWQVASVVLLVVALVWAVWFPLAAGSGARALVVADDRMGPTVLRGDVVIVAPSPDLPYPLDAVVAIDVDGVLIVERVVEERTSEAGVRTLITRADGVSVGPSREVDPAQVDGSVRRVHRLVGYPALWFDEPGSIVWRVVLVLLLVSSALGTASLVVRAELRRQDRLLVSAIASGDRTLRRR